MGNTGNWHEIVKAQGWKRALCFAREWWSLAQGIILNKERGFTGREFLGNTLGRLGSIGKGLECQTKAESIKGGQLLKFIQPGIFFFWFLICLFLLYDYIIYESVNTVSWVSSQISLGEGYLQKIGALGFQEKKWNCKKLTHLFWKTQNCQLCIYRSIW